MTTSKALFLDRDGVINIDHGYTYKIEDFEFVHGILELCLAAQKKGYLIIVVTNQSGIARGYYSKAQFKQFTKWIHSEFWRHGIYIQDTFYCPHHPKLNLSCSCRKPRAGMLHQAIRRYAINTSESLMVGDKRSDIDAARNARIKTPVLLSTTMSKQITPKLQFRQTHYIARELGAIKSLL